MKVKELIEALQALPQNKEVIVLDKNEEEETVNFVGIPGGNKIYIVTKKEEK